MTRPVWNVRPDRPVRWLSREPLSCQNPLSPQCRRLQPQQVEWSVLSATRKPLPCSPRVLDTAGLGEQRMAKDRGVFNTGSLPRSCWRWENRTLPGRTTVALPGQDGGGGCSSEWRAVPSAFPKPAVLPVAERRKPKLFSLGLSVVLVYFITGI